MGRPTAFEKPRRLGPRLAALQEKVELLRAKGGRRRFLPPAAPSQIEAIEERLGCELPVAYRRFVLESSAGEEPTGNVSLLSILDVSLDDLAGGLPLADLGCNVMDRVALEGPTRGSMWQSTDTGLHAHSRTWRGQSKPLDVLSYLEASIDDAIASLPPDLDPETTKLDWMGRELSDLPSFDVAPKLERLLLSGNCIESLPASIARLTRLSVLAVARNPLKLLPAWIGELTALEELAVGECQLDVLPASLASLPKLRRLDATRNQLEGLPASLTRLELVRLSENRLRTLPVDGPTHPLEVDLANNLLVELPDWVAAAPDVVLAGNPLERLPNAFAHRTFTRLELGRTPSRRDPGCDPSWDWERVFEILASSTIEHLRISGSRLSPVPRSFAGLRHVRRLALYDAGLESLPDEIAELSELETLMLDQNLLRAIPDSISRLKNLRAVILFGNPMAKETLETLRSTHPSVRFEHF